MGAAKPKNEVERLEALRRYKLLDTGAERAFDESVALASYVCRVPIALVVLVDEGRQWFKSKVGLNITETSREHGFCAHAILDRGAMVVADAREDGRFADNPMVTGAPHIRFYAGAPLINIEGYALGTLCVIDTEPREMGEEQVGVLEMLARQVMGQMELRRVADDLAQALEGVKTLQEMLPICAWCRNVRNDDGYWGRIEDYLRKNAGVKMTHGICPDCLSKQGV